VAEFWRDDRALSSVVEKTLAAGIALLYIAGMTGLLLGGVVPGYQATAGAELGERTLATAAGEVERTVPQVDGDVESTTTVSLPTQIDDASYRLVLADGTLTLEQAASSLQQERALALPAGVTIEQSTWTSGSDLLIRVDGPANNRTVTIEEAP
jgi:hypothetical protein